MMRPTKLVVVLVLSVVSRVEMSQDVMKNMAVTFSKPLEACKKEMGLSDSVTKEFANFWKEDYQLTDRQTGCAIMCISSKLDLLDPEFQLHHNNAKDFAKKHGADDAMAQQLVDMIHACIENTPIDTDPCINTLLVTKCFKQKIHDLKWAPSMELIMAEVLAEV